MYDQLHALEKKAPAPDRQKVGLIPLNPVSCASLGTKEKCFCVLANNQNHARKPQVPNLPKVMIHTTIT
jgi:hypothetical protein